MPSGRVSWRPARRVSRGSAWRMSRPGPAPTRVPGTSTSTGASGNQGDAERIWGIVSGEQAAQLGALLGVQLRLPGFDRAQTRQFEIPADALDLPDLRLHLAEIQRLGRIRRIRLEHRGQVQQHDLPLGLPADDLAGELDREALDALHLNGRESELLPLSKNVRQERQRLLAPLEPRAMAPARVAAIVGRARHSPAEQRRVRPPAECWPRR